MIGLRPNYQKYLPRFIGIPQLTAKNQQLITPKPTFGQFELFARLGLIQARHKFFL